nr:hypothetical protein [uncultured Acetatifactor sp.]
MKIRVCKINRMTNPLGFTKEPKLEDFEGCVVYSDLERTGDMQTGDSRVNRLFRNARKNDKKWAEKQDKTGTMTSKKLCTS